MDPAQAPARWPLDPAYADGVRALQPDLPAGAAWFSSPEPKARRTAELLTDVEVSLVDDLREHERDTTWVEDFDGVVARAFADPETSALPGWEPLARTRSRVVSAVEAILDGTRDVPVVLVGHGTAWTLLRASTYGEPPDLEWWRSLRMPDLRRL